MPQYSSPIYVDGNDSAISVNDIKQRLFEGLRLPVEPIHSSYRLRGGTIVCTPRSCSNTYRPTPHSISTLTTPELRMNSSDSSNVSRSARKKLLPPQRMLRSSSSYYRILRPALDSGHYFRLLRRHCLLERERARTCYTSADLTSGQDGGVTRR